MGKLSLHPPSGASLAFDKDEVAVGRDPQNDLVIPDGSVSRRHARLVRRGGGWAVVDQGSANGTFLDSHRVSDAALRSGQELRFGVMTFRVELEAGADPDAMAATLGRDSAATVVQPLPLAPPAVPVLAAPGAVTSDVPTLPPPPASTAPAPPPPPPPPGTPSRVPSRFAMGAPPSAAAPTAGSPKKGRGPLFWIGLGCGGCLTIVLGFCALLGGGLYVMARGPVSVVEAHVAHASAGELDAAYAQLGEELRQQVSRDDFAQLVAAHPGLHENAQVKAWPPDGSFNRTNNRARVDALLVSKGGARERLHCALEQQGGEWRIVGLSVEPAS